MGPLAIAAIMMALGEGIKYNEQRRAAKKTRAAVDQGEKRQDEINDKRRQLVLKNLEQYDPTTRAATQEDVATKTTQGLQEVLNTAGETGSIPAAQGKVSETYNTERAKSVADNLKRSSIMASLMGKVRAPNDLRFEEAMKSGEYATRHGELGVIGRGRAVTDEARIRSASQVDPRMMLLGTLLSTGGQMYGLSGMGAGAGTVGAEGAASNIVTEGALESSGGAISGPEYFGMGKPGYFMAQPKPTPWYARGFK